MFFFGNETDSRYIISKLGPLYLFYSPQLFALGLPRPKLVFEKLQVTACIIAQFLTAVTLNPIKIIYC